MSDQMQDQRFEFASRFWSFGNYIVGFGLVQMLAFLYGLADDELLDKVGGPPWGILLGIVVSTAISCALVRACHAQERKLLEAGSAAEEVKKAACMAAKGRVLVLVLTGAGGILLFCLARKGA